MIDGEFMATSPWEKAFFILPRFRKIPGSRDFCHHKNHKVNPASEHKSGINQRNPGPASVIKRRGVMYWSNQDSFESRPFQLKLFKIKPGRTWTWLYGSSSWGQLMTNELSGKTYVSSLNWLLSVSLILLNARIRTIMRISWKDANSRPFFVCFSRPRYDNLPPNIICFSPNHRSVFYFLFSDFFS